MNLTNAVNHFRTITKHHNLVMRYCFRAGLIRQGLLHDLSKYSPTEFLVGAKYYQGNMSPNNAERKETGVSLAWLHHKGRNRHHFEYWIDYSMNPTEGLGLAGARMPKRYVAEMVFDRVSACRVYMGDRYTQDAPLGYFLRSKKRAWYIHPDTKRDLEALLRMWAVKGEDATIRYIRERYLRSDEK